MRNSIDEEGIMTNNIHPTAIIDPSAQICDNITIEPYAVIGKNVKINAGVKICANAYIEYTEIGRNTIVSSGAVIGTPPQDLGYKGEKTFVKIGEDCQIREHVTINRASGEGLCTTLGNNSLLMTGAHIAHNCQVGNNVIMANLATLGGHTIIEDFVFLGGMVAVHQNVKVGEMAIIGGFSATRQDIPPYSKCDGRIASIIGLNTVGLRRRGLSQDERNLLKKAFSYIWYSNLNNKEALQKIKNEIPSNKYVDHLVNFIENSKRGINKRLRNVVDDSE